MFDFVINGSPSYELWNMVIDSSSDGNYQQSFEYGEVVKTSHPRTKVVRLLAVDHKQPIGIIQGIYGYRFGVGGKIVVGGMGGGAPVISLTDEGKRRFVAKGLLMSLEKYAITNRIMECRVYWPESWGMPDLFHELGYRCVREVNACTVNLRKSVQELCNSIQPGMQEKAKTIMKRKVKIEEMQKRDDLRFFHKMAKSSGKSVGFNPPLLAEIEASWDVYRPKKMMKIFLLKQNNEQLAAALVVIHRKTVFATAARFPFTSSELNDFLHWKVMEWACGQGFSFYHLGGVPAILDPKSEYGLYRWKLQYGGKLEKIYNFEKVFLPKTKKFISWTHGLSKTLKKLIART